MDTPILRKRFRLSVRAMHTQKALFALLLGGCAFLLMIQLFLLNSLSMRGYILTKESKENLQLVLRSEQWDARVAKLQTQEFITKTGLPNIMMVRDNLRYVTVPSETITAQK